MKVDILKDPLSDQTPLVHAVTMSSTPNGSVIFQYDEGDYVYQEPNQYGVLNRSFNLGVYSEAAIDGNLVTFWTRPQDAAYTYVLRHLPNS